MSATKSKQAKAKEISLETKKAVMERQGWRSISGVYLTEDHVEFHHVVGRGVGGIGLEFNIVAITPEEHRAFHDGADIKVNGRKRYTAKEFGTLMRNHLILRYPHWNAESCKYHKMWSETDYWNAIKKGKNNDG